MTKCILWLEELLQTIRPWRLRKVLEEKHESVNNLVNPILDTRISFVLRNARVPPLDSETGWTGELWSNLKTKRIAIFFWQKNNQKNVFLNKSDFFKRFFEIFKIFFFDHFWHFWDFFLWIFVFFVFFVFRIFFIFFYFCIFF